MSARAAIACCSSASALRGLIERTPAAVVTIRVLPVPSMFPPELRQATRELPFDVSCAVAPPSIAEGAGIPSPRLGEVLLFSGGRLLGRLAPELTDKRERLMGLLTAGLAPWLGRTELPRAERQDEGDLDPFEIIGVPSTAGFDEVHAAWRQKLAEYHPDRFLRAGEKIRNLAHTETQRLNAAFQAIAKERSALRRS